MESGKGMVFEGEEKVVIKETGKRTMNKEG